MTTPVIESLPTNNSGHEHLNTGFPFDSDDGHFNTELEDIALRHPEFAEHLNPFQRRAANPDRFRSQDPFSDYRSTSRDRPFGSRFQQFGFPFTPDFDDDPLIQQQANERPPQKPEEKVDEKPPQPPQSEERTRRYNPHIQQSNTVDLGQKQEAVDDNRNQRSMSAPPENRNTSNKRFVSSIKIPNFNQPAGDNMGGRMSQPEATPQPQPQQQQQQQQPSSKPTERIIPIHIEGRDEPIIPKNVNVSSSSAGAAPKQPQPQSERIFGQRPSNFTQFLNRGDPQNADNKQRDEQARQDYLRQQQEYQRQQQQDYQKQQQEYQQQQQETFQKQQQQQENIQKHHTPPPEQKPTALDHIQNIQKDVSKLMEDVAKFEGKPRDKQYIYLDEMLTRNLIKLDDIETEGKDTIRQARKEAIKCIERCIQILETKANANEMLLKSAEENLTEKSASQDKLAPTTEAVAKEEPMEVEKENKQVQEAPAEVEGQEKCEQKPAEEVEQKTVVEVKEEPSKTDDSEKVEKTPEPSQDPSTEDESDKKKGKKKTEKK